MSAFSILIVVGLVIRLMLIGNTGFLADVSFWKSWGLAAIDHGIVWTSFNTNINYPPGFIYVLWIMGKLYSLFGNPHDFNSYWRENNFAFLLVSKSIAIAADVFIAWLIYFFFSQKDRLKKLGVTFPLSPNFPLILSAVFFLNPVVIIDSALWGQVESFGIMFTLLAILLLFYKRPYLATFIFITGTLMKLQNIIYLPIYFIFIYRSFGLKTLIKSLSVSAITFVLVCLPFVLAGDLSQVLFLMTINSDYFPWLSLNAHNLWWIVSGAKGLNVTDKITVLGMTNAKTAGLIIFSSFYFLSCLLLYLKTNVRNFFLSLILGIFAFFLFTTQSHERYSYPLVVLMLFLYPFLNLEYGKFATRFVNLKSYLKNFFGSADYFWLLYILASILIFFNIHFGLVYNYPQNGWGFLSQITTPQLTIVSAYFHIVLFFAFFVFVCSQISPLFLIIPFALTAIGLTLTNSSLLLRQNVSLTAFKPIIANQDFSILQVNKSVNSYSGWKSWNRLSNNYFYYRFGFGAHAKSNLTFDINKKFKRFTADIGIDTEAGTQASVVFQIFGDEKKLFESEKMGKFDFPKHVEIDISGVKYLELILDDGGDGINNDHADWLNPVLYP
ncbi:hypothetical protein A3D03_06185 [Candidatus Gottesmanbacteria bacterium RIFCSPHIGHO2_02_FULL_40_13]|uniref:Glycosyl hydrolase family 98 putative carbohydrate-binding module domain-containing protein n=1 Tax=Candidatus Gottesmanbacteria bacterium RIFCSPHIGHO2_02_FULL_40_13 TaxID=1798384 RepID=A0A1F6A5I3_9BACT|nr:MAG: hypothetical protein A3D03_06185 [Candidatus Gottesmanbacteria bacterium RIFCSPHIGHO2_02_FULL_40_13]